MSENLNLGFVLSTDTGIGFLASYAVVTFLLALVGLPLF